MARLFNAYIIVDWSAASKPRTGKDSVWIGVVKRDVRFRRFFEAHNPATRMEAEALLRSLLADLGRRGEKALIGFDFALGYPAGTAAKLGLEAEPAWAAQWRFLAANVVDKKDNTNNRFAVASKMNRLMTDEAAPFWGCPPSDAQRWLTSTKPTIAPPGLPAQFRSAELATQGLSAAGGKAKAGAKPVWQIIGNGTVGSQTIVGVPAVKRLVDALDGKAAVWPFETGWRSLTAETLAPLSAVIAEVYPALIPAAPEPGEVPDRAQVRSLAEHFARLDEQDQLGALFAAPKTATPELTAQVEGEEGWILGA